MKKLLLISLSLILTDCTGLANYTISLDNGYRINRLSADDISIYWDEPIQTRDGTGKDYLYAPEKVTDVWWSNHYFIAKELDPTTEAAIKNRLKTFPLKILLIGL